MGTLYDLLGALPSDEAEGLRTAFRKAAKATHPDINPDNHGRRFHWWFSLAPNLGDTGS